MNEIDTLMREAARYLAAVDTFRGLGHEPRWRPEALIVELGRRGRQSP